MTDWSKQKVVDLKSELKRRGLPQTGLKPALVARLAAAEAEAENGGEDGSPSESDTTVQGDAARHAAASSDTASQITTTQPAPESHEVPAHSDAIEQLPAVVASESNEKEESATLAVSPLPQADNIEPTESLPQAGLSQSAEILVEPTELAEDRQKRKRRSQSPPPSATEASRKRLRPDDDLSEHAEPSEGISLVEQSAVITAEVTSSVDYVEAATKEDEIMEDAEATVDAPFTEHTTKSDAADDNRNGTASEQELEIDTEDRLHLERSSPVSERKDRFKGIFPTKASEDSKIGEAVSSLDEEYRSISPAIHPATSALYIRDFMRPLKVDELKAHLRSLATPPGEEIDPDIMINFHVDTYRTHVFVAFQNISAAARVRSSLHERIWPDEKTRKPLWADFIPSEKVEEWVYEEETQNGGGRGGARKWEIFYDVDADRNVTAMLQESSGVALPGPQRPTLTPSTPALQSKGVAGAPSGPRAEQVAQRAGANLSTLNELFKSTTALPLLYWLPVDKSLANKRLDVIDDVTSKNFTPRAGEEIHRYSFEDSDRFVDRGPEIFAGIRPPPGMRRGGGARGGFRGSFRGGSDRNWDNYRGGQDGYRGGQDGYRGGQDGYRGGQDGYRGGQDGYRGGQDGYRGGQDGYRGGQDGYRGGQDGYRGGRGESYRR